MGRREGQGGPGGVQVQNRRCGEGGGRCSGAGAVQIPQEPEVREPSCRRENVREDPGVKRKAQNPILCIQTAVRACAVVEENE